MGQTTALDSRFIDALLWVHSILRLLGGTAFLRRAHEHRVPHTHWHFLLELHRALRTESPGVNRVQRRRVRLPHRHAHHRVHHRHAARSQVQFAHAEHQQVPKRRNRV